MLGQRRSPFAGSIPVYRLRRWPNTNPTLGLLYALSQHISKHMYQASSKCGVSKHLKHVRNSILSFLKQMLVFWNTYRSTSKCGISLHLTHVCNSILPFFLNTLWCFEKRNQATTKCGVSKHLKHVCNSISSVLKLYLFTLTSQNPATFSCVPIVNLGCLLMPLYVHFKTLSAVSDVSVSTYHIL